MSTRRKKGSLPRPDRSGRIERGLFPGGVPNRSTRPVPGLDYERSAIEAGYRSIAGVDEVGRGALAGPVVAAAVILDPSSVPSGLDDSKRLTPRRREELAEEILASAIECRVAFVDAREIDRINILQATFLAMRNALEALDPSADFVLVDGNLAIPQWSCAQRTVVSGDSVSATIAAASIVAKVSRDSLMKEYSLEWPDYGFSSHVGYGTRSHLEALARLGPTPIHRLTFRGVSPPKTNIQLNLPRPSN